MRQHAPSSDDQQAINEHVLYLYYSSKLALKVYTQTLSEAQKEQARAYLKAHLQARKKTMQQR